MAALLTLPAASASAAQVSGDFDGDGMADLAVDVENQHVGGQPGAGAVQVIYGSHTGLSGNRDRIFTQNTPGVKESAEVGDEFGNSLATGDFNGDGRADLAIGTPFEDLGNPPTTTPASCRSSTAPSTGFERRATSSSSRAGTDSRARLGHPTPSATRSPPPTSAAAARTTLRSARPTRASTGQDGAGAVQVVYGTRHGLRAKHNQRFTQDTPHVTAVAEPSDHFGWSLAATNLGRDRHAELAIGAPFEDLGAVGDAGAVHVLYGSRRGVRAKGNQLFTQDTPEVKDTAEQGDRFRRLARRRQPRPRRPGRPRHRCAVRGRWHGAWRRRRERPLRIAQGPPRQGAAGSSPRTRSESGTGPRTATSSAGHLPLPTSATTSAPISRSGRRASASARFCAPIRQVR